MRVRISNGIVFSFVLLALTGCADINTFNKEVVDTALTCNTVTEKRVLHIESEEAEIKRTRINFWFKNTPTGQIKIFGWLQNTGNYIIEDAEITIYYINDIGKTIHTRSVKLQCLGLLPEQATNWSDDLLNISGAQRIQVAVTMVRRHTVAH